MYCMPVNLCLFLLICLSTSAENANFESCLTPKDKIGQCVTIKACSVLSSLVLQKPVNQDNISYLRKSQCGFEGLQPKVCCPLEDNDRKTFDEIKSDLLPDDNHCGISRDNRIVGGQLTQIGEYPWMALLEYDTPSGRDFRCGGSLINKRYVLTAAHCINKVPKSWTLLGVRLGEFDLSTNPDCESDVPGLGDCADQPIDVGIEEKIVYADYDPNSITQYNDIALLRLDKDIAVTAYVKPICLPRSKELLEKDYSNAVMTVSGWGRTENSSQSEIKLKVQVPVKSDEVCQSTYSTGARVKLINKQLCAGGVKGKDSCTGDSGGPLMALIEDTSQGHWYAAAVVSFGPTPCGAKNWPGVYTKVAPYMPWIVSNLKP